MRSITWLLLVALTICSSTTCDAGGFFRRVPEVGEWARYERPWQSTFSSTAAGTVESSGQSELTLKCVGEVETNGARHLWIEARLDLNNESWAVAKLLVPEDEIVEGDLLDHAVAIWVASENYEPYKAPVDWESLQRDPCVNILVIMFPWTPETAPLEQERSVTIEDEDVLLTSAEAGDIARRIVDDEVGENETLTGSVTWWPSADHAFGIAAADMRWRLHAQGDEKARIESRFQMNLVETGMDAISELPDHN